MCSRDEYVRIAKPATRVSMIGILGINVVAGEWPIGWQHREVLFVQELLEAYVHIEGLGLERADNNEWSVASDPQMMFNVALADVQHLGDHAQKQVGLA